MITQNDLNSTLLDLQDAFDYAQRTRVFLDMAMEYMGSNDSESIVRCEALLTVFEAQFTAKMLEVNRVINELRLESGNPQAPGLRLVG